MISLFKILEVALGTLWGNFGLVLEDILSPLGMLWALWGHLGTLGVTLELLWSHFGSLQLPLGSF